MKNLLFLMTAFMSLLTWGCKKHGFDIPDGYNADSLPLNISVDTSTKPDYSMLHEARLFPGLVDKEEPRLNNVSLKMDLNYIDEKYNRLRISFTPQPQFSTGYYAAPGEVVIIDVPADAKGLTCQIGAWTDNLSGKANPKRYPIVFSRHQLAAGQRNYVRNLFGGHIYIRSAFPLANPVTFTLSNVTKSVDFIVDQTSASTWKQKIQSTKVPWFEFRGKYIIFTLPTDKMKDYLVKHPNFDPQANIKGWDNIILLDYNQWMGLSDTASDPLDLQVELATRYVVDDDISIGYGHSGFPVMGINDAYWFQNAVDGDRSVEMWGALHELGHNQQQNAVWNWSSLIETTNNLHSYKRAERLGTPYKDLHGDSWVEEALTFAKKGTASFDNANLSPFHKIVPFLQIFHRTERYDGKVNGWGFWAYLYRRARHAKRLSLTDVDKRDFLYEALCEFTGKDYIKFFEAWKIPISKYSQELMAEEYPLKMATEIWTYNPFTRTGGTTLISTDISRSNWTIKDVSSQETTGEDGKAANMLDGNLNTFWHTAWYYSQPSYPHSFTIDMSVSRQVSGLYFSQRQNGVNTRPKEFKVWVGDNPDNLTYAYSGTLQNESAQQRFTFSAPATGRYIKVVFSEGYGPTYVSMAEFGAFE